MRGATSLKRGQISLEYLVIIGIALGLLIPGVVFFYAFTKTSEGTSASSRLSDIGLRTVSTAKSVQALGRDAWLTVEFNLPSEVTRIYVNNSAPSGGIMAELVFEYDTPQGPSQAVFFSSVNLTTPYPDGNVTLPHPGIMRLRATSQGAVVNLTEVQ
jgi:hypothetical protein